MPAKVITIPERTSIDNDVVLSLEGNQALNLCLTAEQAQHVWKELCQCFGAAKDPEGTGEELGRNLD